MSPLRSLVTLGLLVVAVARVDAAPYLVKDVHAGAAEHWSVTDLRALGERLIVRAGIEGDVLGTLWGTDGTEAGTVELTPGRFRAEVLATLGGHALFSSSEGGTLELWRSDGTAVGTMRLSDLLSLTHDDDPGVYAVVEAPGRVFLVPCNYRGCTLWVTDGTPQGTLALKDFTPDTNDDERWDQPKVYRRGDGVEFAVVVDVLDEDGEIVEGYQRWVSDGTREGTTPLTAGMPEPPPAMPDDEVTSGPALVGEGLQIWRAGASPMLLIDFTAHGVPPESFAWHFLPHGGVTFFGGFAPGGAPELWRSDGTVHGTAPLVRFAAPPGNANPAHLLDVRGTLYFTAWERLGGYGLWKSDGTESGTVRVAGLPLDRYGWGTGGQMRGMTAVDGIVYVWLADELWRSDGTQAGTFRLPGPPRWMREVEAASGRLYFATGNALLATDGSAAGTVAVATMDVHRIIGSIGGDVVFASRDGQLTLWRSDGTPAGTAPFATVPATASAQVDALAEAGPTLYFSVVGGGRFALWRTDGTAAGTVRLATGAGSVRLAPLGGDVMFIDTDANQLWRSDGTPHGTRAIVSDLPSSWLPGLTAVDGRVFFIRASSQNELWTSDGTPQGTHRVPGVPADCWIGGAAGSTVFLYRTGYGAVELWTSDGSAEGTRRIGDVSAPGGGFAALSGGRYFFPASDPAHGTELWAMPACGEEVCPPSSSTTSSTSSTTSSTSSTTSTTSTTSSTTSTASSTTTTIGCDARCGPTPLERVRGLLRDGARLAPGCLRRPAALRWERAVRRLERIEPAGRAALRRARRALAIAGRATRRPLDHACGTGLDSLVAAARSELGPLLRSERAGHHAARVADAPAP